MEVTIEALSLRSLDGIDEVRASTIQEGLGVAVVPNQEFRLCCSKEPARLSLSVGREIRRTDEKRRLSDVTAARASLSGRPLEGRGQFLIWADSPHRPM